MLRRVSHLLVYAVLALMPFTWEFKGLAPADIALGLAAGLWVLALALDWRASAPGLKKLARYWPMGVYALRTVVAACCSESPKLALVKVFQTVEYFVVAIVLLHDFLTSDFRLPTLDGESRKSEVGSRKFCNSSLIPHSSALHNNPRNSQGPSSRATPQHRPRACPLPNRRHAHRRANTVALFDRKPGHKNAGGVKQK